MKYIGKEFNRVDGMIKADGSHKYPSDLREEDMLILKVKRSEVPHGNIISIDIQQALQVPGVVRIFTSKDVPGTNRYGIVHKDQEILVEKKVRCIGDPICLVAAETKEASEEAIKKIKVNYELLSTVTNPIEALKDDSPHIHEGGNVDYHISCQIRTMERNNREMPIL